MGGTISRRDSFWRAPDAERFSEDWTGVRDLGGAALEKLRRSGEELERRAEEQDRASAAEVDDAGASPQQGDQGAAEDPAALLSTIPGVAFNPGDGVTATDDPAIQDAWDEMSTSDRRAVLRVQDDCDLLVVDGSTAVAQQLSRTPDAAFDVVTLQDGTVVWFELLWERRAWRRS